MQKLLLLLVGKLTVLIGSSQFIGPLKQYTVQSGLPQHVVYDIVQDSTGYLWLGTHDGLARFDGYQFKVFRNDPGNMNSLAENNVLGLAVDKNGNVYSKTNRYLQKLTPSEIFVTYQHQGERGDTLHQASFKKTANDILKINNKFITVNQRDASYNTTHTSTFAQQPYPSTYLHTAAVQYPGWPEYFSLVNAEVNGLLFVNIEKGVIEPVLAPPFNILAHQKIENIFANKDYFHAVTSNNFLYIFDKLAHKLTIDLNKLPLKKGHGKLLHTGLQSDGILLLVYEHSICSVTISPDGKISNFQYILNDSTISFSKVFESLSGILWIGSYGSGLFQYQLPNKGILNNRNILLEQFHTKGMVADLFCDENNTVWANHYSDILYYPINNASKQPFLANMLSNAHTMPKEIASILPKGDIQFDKYYRKIFMAIGLPALKEHYSIAGKGGEKYYRDHQVIYNEAGNKHWNLNAYIEATAIDDLNRWWFGTRGNGLFCFDSENETLVQYSYAQSGKGLLSNHINALLWDNLHKTLWIGTHHGLTKLDMYNLQFENFTIDQGLPHPHIYAMLQDNKGNIWSGTGNGLARLNLTTGEITTFSKRDGLINSEFNRNAAVKTKEGYLFFGGTDGIDVLDPYIISLPNNIPSTHITSVQVNNAEINPEKWSSNPLKLDYKQNNIRISFSTLSFTQKHQTLYAYALTDTTKNWQTASGDPLVQFAALPPGKYNFFVKAAFSSNTWGPVCKFSFTINKPWWQQWWFYGMVGLSFAGTAYGFMKYRMRQQLKVIELRQRIQRDLHDDVGATLSSVKAYADILKDQPGNTMIAGLIQSNAEEMIDRLDLIAWSANPHHDTLESLLEKIKIFAYPLLSASGIRFSVVNKIEQKNLLVPGSHRQHLYLITKEAVNNAAKHSKAENCILSLFLKDGQLFWQVEDDGKGMVAIENQGNGLANMTARAKEAGGTLVWNAYPGKGCTILVSLSYPFKSMV